MTDSSKFRLATQPAKKLEAQLWGGFAGELQPVLEAKLASQQRSSERAYAAWALARWHVFNKQYVKALHYLWQRLAIDPGVKQSKAYRLLLADCLNRLGKADMAWDMLALGPVTERDDIDLLLASANSLNICDEEGAAAEWLTLVNNVFIPMGFVPLALRFPGQPLSIFNLRCLPAPELPAELLASAKVSIIMPAFNAAEQIELALHSLQQQTWSNFEVLVADDCSTDKTRAVVLAFAEQDSRIKLVGLDYNGGAYAARNKALAHATGDLITVHDSDDWSHAQKLEIQVKHLLGNPRVIANVTDWARAREDLYFTGTFRAHGSLVSENTSSLMFRREVVDALGGWNLARTSADSEFVMRLRTYYGEEAVQRLHKGLPLSFALDQETSLTRTTETHAKTLFYGARRDYREAAQVWHDTFDKVSASSALKVPLEKSLPVFPIPMVMEIDRTGESRQYDVLVIADFNLSGGAYVSTMNYINAAVSLGKKVAVFHWRRADLDVRVPLRRALREQAMAGRFDILSAGDRVKVDTVLVGYPVVLNYKLDTVPVIEAQRFVILVNQMASRLTTGADPQYDPRQIQANVFELFGIEPLWVPISGYVRQLMWQDVRYPVPHEDIWNPLLDVDSWCQFRVKWRGDERDWPVIGRHSRDHYTKWPKTKAALEAAYCVGRSCHVRLLGGAGHALNMLGDTPENWHVLDYAESAHEFLCELDFFIHYPHEEYIEEFGRAVLEAMGLGIPVILPPVFSHTFGDYAHYAEPEDVWSLIQQLWSSPALYQQSADKALQFVTDKAAYHVLAGRLARLVSPRDVIKTQDTMKLTERRIAELEFEKQELQAQLMEKEVLMEAHVNTLADLTEKLEAQRQELRKLRATWKPLRWLVKSSEPALYPAPSGLLRLIKRVKKRIPQKAVTVIAQSPLFDAQWYLQQYPELAKDSLAQRNPALHYLQKGGFEGLNPGPGFDSAWYLTHNPDVSGAGVNPLLHYMLYGMDEGRMPQVSQA